MRVERRVQPVQQRAVLITGGAGGIGAASALAIAARGYSVLVADLDLAASQRIADEIVLQGGVAAAFTLDVTDPDAAIAAVAAARELGPLGGVVNSAGVVHLGGAQEVTDSDWNRVIAINLTGSFNVCRAAIASFGESGGSMVNLSSTAGRTASVYSSPAYVASKAGVIGLTMSLAKQLAPLNIRVNAVAPGIIDTPMIRGYGEERNRLLLLGIPLARVGSAQEVAATVDFLISDQSSYITGQTISVNGGTFIS